MAWSQAESDSTSANMTSSECNINPFPSKCFPDFNARLNGSSEVPPVDTQATGKAVLVAPRNESGVLLYKINVTGMTPSAVHIHQGKVDENGPIVATLYKSGIVPCCVIGKITADMLEGPLKGKTIGDLEVLFTTEKAYMNVHSEQHPDGEIRGQIYHITVQFPEP